MKYRKTIKQILLIISFFYTLYFILYSPVRAQQLSLSLTPPVLNVTIKPGKSILIAYTVTNVGDPVILRSIVLPFEPKGTSGGMRILPEFEGPVRFELDNSNIKLNTPFFLKTRDRQQLLLRIRIPEGAPEGDYYYSLLVQSEAPPTQEGIVASRASGAIGSPILITVTESGKIDVKANIALFDIVPRFKFNLFGKTVRLVETTDRIPVHLILHNQGINKIQPYGTINLEGNFGERATYDILPQNVLSQSERLLTATPQGELKPNDTPVTLMLKGFFIGKYDVDTRFNFGEGTPFLESHVSFIALPIKFIIGLIVALCIGFFIVRRLKQPNETEM